MRHALCNYRRVHSAVSEIRSPPPNPGRLTSNAPVATFVAMRLDIALGTSGW
jgi:hypothetical protein